MENNTKNGNPRQLRLACSSCGRLFRINVPAKPGNYATACPHCAAKIKLTLSPSNEIPKKPKTNGLVIPKVKEPVLGDPVKVKDKVFIIKTRAIVNRPYKAVCPDCGEDIALLPKRSNLLLTARCKKCGTLILYKAVENNDATQQ